MIPKLDLATYTKEQLVEAMTCPMNRHGTREEHNWCSDEELHHHPEWLMEHYIRCGGAKEFAKRRAEFQKLCDVLEDCHHGTDCPLALIISGWTHCPIRNNPGCYKRPPETTIS